MTATFKFLFSIQVTPTGIERGFVD